jgi:hypothetical protein
MYEVLKKSIFKNRPSLLCIFVPFSPRWIQNKADTHLFPGENSATYMCQRLHTFFPGENSQRLYTFSQEEILQSKYTNCYIPFPEGEILQSTFTNGYIPFPQGEILLHTGTFTGTVLTATFLSHRGKFHTLHVPTATYLFPRGEILQSTSSHVYRFSKGKFYNMSLPTATYLFPRGKFYYIPVNLQVLTATLSFPQGKIPHSTCTNGYIPFPQGEILSPSDVKRDSSLSDILEDSNGLA